MTKRIPLSIFFSILTIAVSIGQSVTLVKDITPGAPSSNLANFTSESSTEPIENLRVFDLAGRQILTDISFEEGRKDISLDLSNQRGFFIILISTVEGRHVIRLGTFD